MKIKVLLLAGAIALNGHLQADTLVGDHTVTGNLTVGDSGDKKNLTVTGTSKLNGRVGVGTDSPAAQEHIVPGATTTKGLIVQGASSQTANLQEWQDSGGTAFGSISAGGNFTLNATPGDNMKIYVRQTGAASGSSYYAARFDADPAGSSLGRAYGIYAQATGYNNTTDYAAGLEARAISVGSSGTSPRLVALSGYAYDTATGLTIGDSYGAIGSTGFYNSVSTGTMTNAYGLVAEAGYPFAAGQTLTNATGIYANVNATSNGRGIHINNVNSGSNAYGIFLNSVTSGGGAHNYGLYLQGGTNNYLAGNLGIGTNSPGAKLDVNGNVRVSGSLTVSGSTSVNSTAANGFVFGGTYGSGTIPIEGAGTRVMWQPSKGAFRAGGVSGTQWNNSNVGAHSIGMGYDVVANGSHSVAIGNGASASGAGSVSLGNSISSGTNSVAMNGGTADGYQSTAISAGYASGTSSVALSGGSAYLTLATGMSGGGANAVGAVGMSGGYAEGPYSTVMSSGYTYGANSFATGPGTSAMAKNCAVVGQYNLTSGTEDPENWVATDPLFVVGNGTGDSGDLPEVQNRNAFVVYKNGDIEMTGKVTMPPQGDISMGEFGE